jgi:hypothetical protein
MDTQEVEIDLLSDDELDAVAGGQINTLVDAFVHGGSCAPPDNDTVRRFKDGRIVAIFEGVLDVVHGQNLAMANDTLLGKSREPEAAVPSPPCMSAASAGAP